MKITLQNLKLLFEILNIEQKHRSENAILPRYQKTDLSLSQRIISFYVNALVKFLFK